MLAGGEDVKLCWSLGIQIWNLLAVIYVHPSIHPYIHTSCIPPCGEHGGAGASQLPSGERLDSQVTSSSQKSKYDQIPFRWAFIATKPEWNLSLHLFKYCSDGDHYLSLGSHFCFIIFKFKRHFSIHLSRNTSVFAWLSSWAHIDHSHLSGTWISNHPRVQGKRANSK